jgi:protein-tyrosine phosphatase
MWPQNSAMKRKNVLFVCLGNICRSPLAEAIFKHKIKGTALEQQVEADSCGTANYHVGDSPDHRTIANAVKNGVAISHKGRQLCNADFAEYDYILAMDNSNYQNILRVDGSKGYENKVQLMRNFDPHGKGHEVPDPYYGGEAGFQEVFDILDRSMDVFIQELKKDIAK